MEEERVICIGEEEAGGRLDSVLSGFFDDISRSRAAGLIREGRVARIKNTGDEIVSKSSEKTVAGEEYCIRIPAPEPMEAAPEDIPLDILYEDSDVIVVNKPKGMVVHPDTTHKSHTLVNALLYHCRDLAGVGEVQRPGIVHRIDMDTTGSVIVCKNDRAHASVSAQLKEHSITRRYVALVAGGFSSDEGCVDAAIGRSRKDRKKMAVVGSGPAGGALQGRRAVTHYRVLERFKGYTLVECALETGRTHQIRVHMAHISHPLVGDEVYGSERVNRDFKGLQGQCLHAAILGFEHPSTGEYIEVEAPMPEYFTRLLSRLRSLR